MKANPSRMSIQVRFHLINWPKIIVTQIKGLIEELAKQQSQPGSITQKIGDLYNIAMDSAKLNADGVALIKEYLDKLAAIKDRNGLSQEIATMHRDGFGPFFGLYVGADDMNSSMNMAQLYQGRFKLGGT